MDDVAITELEKIDATRVDGVGMPANGIPILLMKTVADEDVEKDWAEWDANHGGSGTGGKAGDSKASAASAVARAKQTIADHKAGKKVSAADLKNAHDVHEAHEAHLAEEKKEGKAPAAAKPKAATAKPAAAKPAAKPAAKKDLAKAGARDCPKCGHGHDADHKGNTCTECGADLPAASEAAKELVRAILKAVGPDGSIDEAPDIAGGGDVISRIADLMISECQEIKAGNVAEIADVATLCRAAELVWSWRTGETAIATGTFMPATMLMQSAKDVDWTEEQWSEWLAELQKAIPGAHLLSPGKPDEDAEKSQIAEEEADMDTVVKTGDLTEVVKAAVTEANAPLLKRVDDLESSNKALRGELAKVKATPVPGGPVLSRNAQVKTPGSAVNEDLAAKAAYYRQMADTVTDRGTADGYRKLAREADAKAVTLPS